jgi:hypothetical protein
MRVPGLKSEYVRDLCRPPAVLKRPEKSRLRGKEVWFRVIFLGLPVLLKAGARVFRAFSRAGIDEARLERRDPNLEIYRYRAGKDLF